MAFFFKCKGDSAKRDSSDKVVDELHTIKTAVKVLYTKVGELQASVKDLKASSKTESQSLRGLVQGISKEIKSNATTNNLRGKPLCMGIILFLDWKTANSYLFFVFCGAILLYLLFYGPIFLLAPNVCEQCNTTKYVLGAAVVVALGYGFMHVKGISVSDVVNGTKYTVASTISNVTKKLEQKSAELTEKMRILTERIEKYSKKDEQKNMDVPKPTEKSNSNTDQEYSDLLFKVVMEEGEGLDEEYLGEVYDYLNENDVAARGFISKSSNMRKKWVKDFGKKAFEKI